MEENEMPEHWGVAFLWLFADWGRGQRGSFWCYLLCYVFYQGRGQTGDSAVGSRKVECRDKQSDRNVIECREKQSKRNVIECKYM